jgi:hypothetical protein
MSEVVAEANTNAIAVMRDKTAARDDLGGWGTSSSAAFCRDIPSRAAFGSVGTRG